jgi:hypothetical protein
MYRLLAGPERYCIRYGFPGWLKTGFFFLIVLGKRLDSDLMQLEGFVNFRVVIFQKCLARLSIFPENVREDYRTFAKKSGSIPQQFKKIRA